MGAAFVLSDGMNFVEDQSFGGAEKLPAARRSEQNIQRLRRGDENMRRPAHHRLALPRRRIARAHRHANRRQKNPLAPRQMINLRQRRLKILGDIVAESF